MKLVFELKNKNELDAEHVKRVRNLTLDKNNPMGLKGEYGLYSSNEWWNNIEKNILPSKLFYGEITRVYFAGQDSILENNSFDFITNKGEIMSSGIYLNDTDDIKLFSVGRKVCIQYIYEKLKSGDDVELVLNMWVS